MACIDADAKNDPECAKVKQSFFGPLGCNKACEAAILATASCDGPTTADACSAKISLPCSSSSSSGSGRSAALGRLAVVTAAAVVVAAL
jgi:hypothetical protein